MSIAKPEDSWCSLVTLPPTARRLILAADRAQFRGDAATCIDMIDAFYASLEAGLVSHDATDINPAAGAVERELAFVMSALWHEPDTEPAEYEEAATG